MEQIRFLEKAEVYIQRASNLYNIYKDEKHIFEYAKLIYDNNLVLRDLLIENCYVLDSCFKIDCLNIIIHLDIWLSKFISLEKELQPLYDTVFIFENKYTYPKESEFRLMKFLQKLKSNN